MGTALRPSWTIGRSPPDCLGYTLKGEMPKQLEAAISDDTSFYRNMQQQCITHTQRNHTTYVHGFTIFSEGIQV